MVTGTLSSESTADFGDFEDVEALASELEDVELAQSGDRRAFARLYRAYGPMVHGIVLSRVRLHEAADLVQDVFAIALRRIGQLDEAKAFGGWLATIARNQTIDHHRRARPMLEFTESPGRSSTARQTEALRVLDRIRALPEAYRETLTLRLVEGMTGPEIALRTGLTPGSVRVNLHRGMKLLRAALGEDKDND